MPPSRLQFDYLSAYEIATGKAGVGGSQLLQQSDRLKAALKNATYLDKVINNLSKVTGADHVPKFLGPDRTLVPLPGSAKTSSKTLWVSEIWCQALIANGYGERIAPVIRRVTTIRKSAYCAPSERPSPAEHRETFTIDDDLTPLTRVTLVDDVITRGSTMAAAAALIRERYPASDIYAFAFASPASPDQLRSVLNSHSGTIEYDLALDRVQRTWYM